MANGGGLAFAPVVGVSWHHDIFTLAAGGHPFPGATGYQYPDPSGVHSQRYWSGDAWTARVADAYGVIAVSHLDGEFGPPSDGPPQPATVAIE